MKRYTVAELAKLAGVTTTTVYRKRSTVLNTYHKVLNGKNVFEIPDDIDILALLDVEQVLNRNPADIQQVSTGVEHVQQGTEAASSPIEGRNFVQEIEALTAEKNLLQAQLEGLNGILAAKDEMITALQQRIAYMEGQLQQQMEVVNRLTLPAPRKTLGERFKAALGIKPKTP